MNLLDVATRKEWRKWLSKHHDSEREIWLVFHKQQRSIAYEDAVEEALCFGWIDSIIRRIDEDRYARKFTPRKPDSKWSDLNVRRYERIKAAGLLAPAGRKLAPTGKRSAPPPVTASDAGDLQNALRSNPRARENFEKLGPSYQRLYLLWIASAKRAETKQKRIAEAVEKLERGEKLGLK